MLYFDWLLSRLLYLEISKQRDENYNVCGYKLFWRSQILCYKFDQWWTTVKETSSQCLKEDFYYTITLHYLTVLG